MGGLVRIIDNVTRVETEKDVDLLIGGGATSVATEINITDLNLSSANTEFSLVLQANLKQLTIRNRSMTTTKFAFIENESGTDYSTIPPGCERTITNIDFNDKILYVQASIISVVEIIELYA
jgi:hypothetical protein